MGPVPTLVNVEQGNEMQCARISKGASILIPILTLNRSKKYWGEDAHEFKCAPFHPLRLLPFFSLLPTNLYVAGLSAGCPHPKPPQAFPEYGATS